MMQIVVSLLLPMLVAGVGFSVPEPGCVMLQHCNCTHHVCCESGDISTEMTGADAFVRHCEHRHHHEQVRLMMDAGERTVRLLVAAPCTPVSRDAWTSGNLPLVSRYSCGMVLCVPRVPISEYRWRPLTC